MTDIARSAPRAVRPPSMIGVIARKELTEIVRDGRFVWSAAIMALLLLAALATGWQRYADYRAMETAAQAQSNEQFYHQGDKNPHSGAHFGNYAFKQAAPLAFFDGGIDGFAGSFVFMEAHRQNLSQSPSASDQSAVTRFGELNGATILQLLAPLLIIFLGFSAFAGERERGTLRQLMSVGVSRRELLWGKTLGVGGAAALVIVPCLLLAALAIAAIGVPPGEALGARIAVMALAYAGYGAIFLFLTLAVSAIASTPRAALIAMVGFWAFAVFLMPKAAGEISKLVHPSPSLGEFQTDLQETRAKGLGGPPPRARLAMYKKQLLKKYGVEDVSQLPIYWVSTSMQKMEDMDHVFYDYYYKGLNATYLKQRRVQDALGVIDPALPLASLSMGLAGTDLVHQSRFGDSAEAHRRMMVRKVNDYLSKMAVGYNRNLTASAEASNASMESNDRVLVAPEKIFRMVPPFRYAPPSFAEVIGEYKLALIVLAAWLALAVGAAWMAVDRLRPQAR